MDTEDLSELESLRQAATRRNVQKILDESIRRAEIVMAKTKTAKQSQAIQGDEGLVKTPILRDDLTLRDEIPQYNWTQTDSAIM